MNPILSALKLFAKTFGTKVGGFAGWFYGKILFYGGRAILEMIEDWARRMKREGVQEEKRKELEEVAAKPEAKPEEVGKAYEDYINSGRS